MGSRRKRNADEIAAYLYELERASGKSRDDGNADGTGAGLDGKSPKSQRFEKSGLFSGG
jgi:hypothetical protein